jgi:hypothetical protein
MGRGKLSSVIQIIDAVKALTGVTNNNEAMNDNNTPIIVPSTFFALL